MRPICTLSTSEKILIYLYFDNLLEWNEKYWNCGIYDLRLKWKSFGLSSNSWHSLGLMIWWKTRNWGILTSFLWAKISSEWRLITNACSMHWVRSVLYKWPTPCQSVFILTQLLTDDEIQKVLSQFFLYTRLQADVMTSCDEHLSVDWFETHFILEFRFWQRTYALRSDIQISSSKLLV